MWHLFGRDYDQRTVAQILQAPEHYKGSMKAIALAYGCKMPTEKQEKRTKKRKLVRTMTESEEDVMFVQERSLVFPHR